LTTDDIGFAEFSEDHLRWDRASWWAWNHSAKGKKS
jgi:hypothetical protein